MLKHILLLTLSTSTLLSNICTIDITKTTLDLQCEDASFFSLLMSTLGVCIADAICMSVCILKLELGNERKYTDSGAKRLYYHNAGHWYDSPSWLGLEVVPFKTW